jgi:aminoglycoside phosphotransferase (APT) family kinase protein
LFTNNEGEAVLCEVITNTINLMRDAGVEDYAVLGRRALDNWTKRGRTVFGQGDIWFGTILVGFEDGELEVGICDWEFAGFNHPAGDIAQLGQDAQFFLCDKSIG